MSRANDLLRKIDEATSLSWSMYRRDNIDPADRESHVKTTDPDAVLDDHEPIPLEGIVASDNDPWANKEGANGFDEFIAGIQEV